MRLGTFLFILIGGVAIAAFWLVWQLILRPIAVARGMIPMTGYDYVVQGWKAERCGHWAEALKAYNLAISNFPRYVEAKERRDALLTAHPELAADATPEPEGSQPWGGLRLKRRTGRAPRSASGTTAPTPPSTPSSATPPTANGP